MTSPLSPPPKKNPLVRLRLPTLPPATRSRQALGLTAAAAEGQFKLQVCQSCNAVQYPPRELCHQCLSSKLLWQRVKPQGKLIATTTLHHSNDLYYRERLPWRIGTVQLDAGPSAIAHVHSACALNDTVRLALKLDRSGQAVLIALPNHKVAYMEDDPVLRETSCDPKFRRVLITDGSTAIGQACATALLDAGAKQVFLGNPSPWKPNPALEKLAADERVSVHTLDLGDTRSVEQLSRRLGGQVEILVNTANHQRDGRILFNQGLTKAQDAMDINCFGLMRLAQHFGPAMASRAADGVNNAVAWVNLLSIYALYNPPTKATWAASQAAALSVSRSLRADFQASGIRVLNVFTGPLESEWEQLTPPPLVRPAALARAVVSALQEGLEDIYVGDIAKEIVARLQENPKGLERELGQQTE